MALARAAYAAADVYLLDDPLSAVDAHVGRQIFDQCICGLMQDSTRVLVSHQLQYLPAADVVVVMRGGTVLDVGGYKELLARGVDLSTVVKEAEGDTAVLASPVKEGTPVDLTAEAMLPELADPSAQPGVDSRDSRLTPTKRDSPSPASPPWTRRNHSTLSESDRSSLLNTLTLKEKDGKVTKASHDRSSWQYITTHNAVVFIISYPFSG